MLGIACREMECPHPDSNGDRALIRCFYVISVAFSQLNYGGVMDRLRLELRPPACRAGMLPLTLPAQWRLGAELNRLHLALRASALPIELPNRTFRLAAAAGFEPASVRLTAGRSA